VFAFTVVGAGSNAATGAAPPSSPPDYGGSPGFFEQLLRATAQTGHSVSAAETPATATPGVRVNVTKSAMPFGGAWSSTTGAASLSPSPGVSEVSGVIDRLPQATAPAGHSDFVAETPAATSGIANRSLEQVPAKAAAGTTVNIAKSATPFAYGGSSTTGATSLSASPGVSEVSGVVDQVRQATAAAGHSDSVAETQAATFGITTGSSQNVPATTAACVTVNPIKPRVKADSTDESSSLDSDIVVPSVKPAQAAVIVRQAPEKTRGSDHRVFSHDESTEGLPTPRVPGSGIPSEQNTGLPSSIQAQAPASGSAPELASQPSAPLLQLEASVKTTLPIPTDALFSPGIGELAFAARIRPAGAPVQLQSYSTPAGSSIAAGDRSSQTVAAPGEASAKHGDPGTGKQENSPPPASGPVSSAPKSSFRKGEEADNAANAVEPNRVLPAQPVIQSFGTAVPAEPGLTAKPAPAGPIVVPPEPAHVLLDKPSQAASPARNISLQVEGASGQTVDIKINSRSGDLNVAVRAGDENVAQNLRQGLDDLEVRLAQNGYHAETWHSGHTGSTTEPAAPASHSSNSSSQQQSQSGSGSQHDRGQRDNKPSNRPRWVNEMASTLKAQPAEKGNENGISS